jgi:hypothetical protein
MNLRCKVFRASEAGELEQAINRFFADELAALGTVQFEEITQSESPSGVTVVVWYSLLDEADEILDEEEPQYERYDESEKELA